jgi:hypothetical protein
MAGELLSRRGLLFALAAGGVAAGNLLRGGVAFGAGSEEIDLAKVPAKVKEGAGKAVPGAKWTGATKYVYGGEVSYELEGEDASKKKVWVDLTPEGEVNEVSSLIESGKVPEVVAAALKKRMPRFAVSTSYEARKDGKVVGYYFDGKRPRDKEEITVSVSPDGKEIEIDEG